MELDDSIYLVTFMLNREDRRLVEVIVRLSEAPESSAEINSIPLDEFKRILRQIKTPEERIKKHLQILESGRSFLIQFYSMDLIQNLGLLNTHSIEDAPTSQQPPSPAWKATGATRAPQRAT